MNSVGLFDKNWTQAQRLTCLGVSLIGASAFIVGLIANMSLITLAPPTGTVLMTAGGVAIGIPPILSLIKGVHAYLNKEIPPAPPNAELSDPKLKGLFHRYLLSQQSERKLEKKWDESQFENRAQRMTKISLVQQKRLIEEIGITKELASSRAAFIAKWFDFLIHTSNYPEDRAIKIACYYDYLIHAPNYTQKFENKINRKLAYIFLRHVNIDAIDPSVLMEDYLPKLRAIADELVIETGGYGKKLVRPDGEKYSFYNVVWTRFYDRHSNELPAGLL